MQEYAHLIACNKDVLGGTSVFIGTRVPAKTLLDYLRKGHSIDDFLDDFSTVTTQQAQALLASFEQVTQSALPCSFERV
ncbi:MAG: DUF433 domain-containing protein [Armatimonadetes bacterium]|nr:DUF433 domain-containing protein [Armatimonadota bacterium]